MNSTNMYSPIVGRIYPIPTDILSPICIYLYSINTICRIQIIQGPDLPGPDLPQQNFQGPNLPPRGPICRGPICRGPICRGPICRGPICHKKWGPICRGPICRGPICLEPIVARCDHLRGALACSMAPLHALLSSSFTQMWHSTLFCSSAILSFWAQFCSWSKSWLQ